MRYLAMQNITKEMLAYPPATIFCIFKGKDELESAKKNMSVDPRPMNIVI